MSQEDSIQPSNQIDEEIQVIEDNSEPKTDPNNNESVKDEVVLQQKNQERIKNQQDELIETKNKESSSNSKLNQLHNDKELQQVKLSDDLKRDLQHMTPIKSFDGKEQHMQDDEYMDDFIGSYNDLGIVEDDAPGTDSYRDDDYEMMEDEIQEPISRVEARTQLANSRSQTDSKVGSGLIGSSGETRREGIVIDQRVNEQKDQLKRKKIDLDDEASIPDIRVKRRSSTLEDLNSDQTREYQSNASTINGTNKKSRIIRPDDKQRRSQSRPALDSNQLNLSMRKDSSSVLSKTQQLQIMQSVEQQELFNQSPHQRSSTNSQKLVREKFQINEIQQSDKNSPDITQIMIVGAASQDNVVPLTEVSNPGENQQLDQAINQEEMRVDGGEIGRITEESVAERHSISLQKKSFDDTQKISKSNEEQTVQANDKNRQVDKKKSKQPVKPSRTPIIDKNQAVVLNSRKMTAKNQHLQNVSSNNSRLNQPKVSTSVRHVRKGSKVASINQKQ